MIPLPRMDGRVRALLGALLVGLAVFVTGKISVDLSRLSANVAAVWLANAIPLAILLGRPRREWWRYAVATAIGNLAIYALRGDGLTLSLSFAACNVAEIVVAATLLHRLRATDILGSLRSLLLFFGLGAGLSCGLAAALGAVFASHAFQAPYLTIWSTWWIADAVGMIVLTPALVVLSRRNRQVRVMPRAAAEFMVIAAGLATATYLSSDNLLEYSLASRIAFKAVLPLVIWAAVRFGRSGATLANLLMIAMSIGAVILNSHGGADAATLLDSLQAAQLRLLTMAAVALLLAALLEERRSAMARLNDAIESMSESFALFDADDRLVLANSQHRQAYAHGNALFAPGTSFEDIIRGGIALGQHPEALGREEEWVSERLRRHRNPGPPFEQHLGDERWDRISERRTSEGGIVGVWTDITDLKRQEEELRERAEQLKATIAKLERSEAELQQQAGTLRDLAWESAEQRERAIAGSRAKSDFLAMMSHEIRSPLNGIIGNTDLLLDSPLAPGQRRSVEVVRQCGAALITVIDDILDFSKIEAGKLDLACDDFDLGESLENVAAMTRVAAQNKGLKLAVALGEDVPRSVKGDENRLRQILLNLVANAVKFTETGGIDIGVELVAADPERIMVRFAVRDTGIGIPLEAQAQLFDAFYQVDGSYRRKARGTGLGLAICRRLVQLMGGEIGVESLPGMGSRFWFTAALAHGERQISSTEAARSAPENGAPARILLVDDLDVNRDIASALLTQAGHAVDCAVDGAQAVSAAAAKEYDLVLMDVQMPVMDGFEATVRIRSLPSPNRNVPIIAMTAYATRQDIQHCILVGMNGHIAKPIERKTLLEAVRTKSTGSAPANRTALGIDSRELLSCPVLDDLERDVGRGELVRFAGAIRKRVETAMDHLRDDAIAGRFAQIEAVAHKMLSATGCIGLKRLSALFAELQDGAARVRSGVPVDVIETIDHTEEVARESIRLLLLQVPECDDQPREQAAAGADLSAGRAQG